MYITNRQEIIFYTIIKMQEPTLKELGQELEIAQKTITKEIESLNYFLKKYDTTIKLKGKQGLKINSIYHKAELIDIVRNNLALSVKDQFELLILLNKEAINLYELENQLLISRKSISKLIKATTKDLKLEKNNKSGIISTLNNYDKFFKATLIINNYIDVINYKVNFLKILKQLNEIIDVDKCAYNFKEICQTYTDVSIKKYFIANKLQTILKEDFKWHNLLQPLKMNQNNQKEHQYILIKQEVDFFWKMNTK